MYSITVLPATLTPVQSERSETVSAGHFQARYVSRAGPPDASSRELLLAEVDVQVLAVGLAKAVAEPRPDAEGIRLGHLRLARLRLLLQTVHVWGGGEPSTWASGKVVARPTPGLSELLPNTVEQGSSIGPCAGRQAEAGAHQTWVESNHRSAEAEHRPAEPVFGELTAQYEALPHPYDHCSLNARRTESALLPGVVDQWHPRTAHRPGPGPGYYATLRSLRLVPKRPPDLPDLLLLPPGIAGGDIDAMASERPGRSHPFPLTRANERFRKEEFLNKGVLCLCMNTHGIGLIALNHNVGVARCL